MKYSGRSNFLLYFRSCNDHKFYFEISVATIMSYEHVWFLLIMKSQILPNLLWFVPLFKIKSAKFQLGSKKKKHNFPGSHPLVLAVTHLFLILFSSVSCPTSILFSLIQTHSRDLKAVLSMSVTEYSFRIPAKEKKPPN